MNKSGHVPVVTEVALDTKGNNESTRAHIHTLVLSSPCLSPLLPSVLLSFSLLLCPCLLSFSLLSSLLLSSPFLCPCLVSSLLLSSPFLCPCLVSSLLLSFSSPLSFCPSRRREDWSSQVLLMVMSVFTWTQPLNKCSLSLPPSMFWLYWHVIAKVIIHDAN